MKINWTRKNKIWTGIGGLVVAVLAALLVFTFIGMPGGGKLLGKAEIDTGSKRIYLWSDWIGLATGVVELRNNTSQNIFLFSITNGLGSEGELHGGDFLKPGETKKFDYKGWWIIEAEPVLPTLLSDQGSGGGAGEGGLRMGRWR